MITFATLLNQKVVVPSSNGKYYAVETHYFIECLRPSVAKVLFDEGFYLTRYPDIAEALAAGTIASAHEHYLMRGYYENRLPYEISVDEEWYLDAYEDVKKAVRGGEFTSGQEHFDTRGFREGRLPFPRFALKTPAIG
jgi:hypothetical protein